MKIFVSVDIEGVAGVTETMQGKRGNQEYETARRLMTEEANAAVIGAFNGGATEVTVADSHGLMRNIIVTDLDPRARLVSGKPRPQSMIEGLDSTYSGVVMIGFHAAADNIGVLSHTISGLAFHRILINGIICGEPTLFAGHAAEMGVPLLAISGDDRLLGEVSQQFPDTNGIMVKRAVGANSADSLSPAKARELIEERVCAAVQCAREVSARMPADPPFEIVVTLNHQLQADAACLLPFVVRLSARDISFRAKSYREAISSLSGLALIAGAVG